MTNIKKVAQKAGVSASTVSRALSGKIFVKEETRERILRAVAELDYRPNLIARGLKEGRSRFIALILPNITNPIFPKLVKHLEERAGDRGYSLVLFDSHGDKGREKDIVESVGAHFVAGVLLSSATDDIAHLDVLRKQGIPLVMVNRDFEADYQCVVSDNFASGQVVTSHLIERGHERIACLLGDTGMLHYRQRRDGFFQAMREYGLKVRREYLIDKVMDVEESHAATRRLLALRQRPTAIFCFSDYLVLGVYSAANALGLRIPGDISVAGHDNIDIAPHLIPPLTSYEMPTEGIAAAAVDALVAAIESPMRQSRGNIIVEARLIVRKSVASPEGLG